MVEGFDGDGGGLAPLAIAAEDEVFGVGIEDFGLLGFGLEVEGGFGPFAGFCGYGLLRFLGMVTAFFSRVVAKRAVTAGRRPAQ